jgi:hypothetical protein
MSYNNLIEFVKDFVNEVSRGFIEGTVPNLSSRKRREKKDEKVKM